MEKVKTRKGKIKTKNKVVYIMARQKESACC